MSQFDPAEFERQVHHLLAAYRKLKADYDSLAATREAEVRRSREIRERLNGVIERVRALEAEAKHEAGNRHVQPTGDADHGQ